MTTHVLRAPFIRARRWLFAALVLGTTASATFEMAGIVGAAGITALEILILTLFVPTFGWITVSFWNAVLGFLLCALGRDPISLERVARTDERDDPAATGSAPAGRGEGPASAGPPLTTRTALVMPAHNEDPALVLGGLAAILRSLEETGEAHHFDVHLLSDTTDAVLAVREEAAWRRMRTASERPHRLHYRRRADNGGRKAGNIAEFCTRCVDDYDFMVVLDADSVMSGRTIVELVRTMEANPDAGLLQTVPIPARQRTRFGRFVQFSAALYSPMLAAGQAFWQGDAANYWGHNAIIRLRPFVDHCRLPVLPGRPPLGGAVLSHDFVEAALLRRAGWRVWLLARLGGSWEEVPGNVVDFAKRDRRWAQGSLQHLRLLAEPGLHPVSRTHFALGATGYLSSALWLMILLAGTAYVLVPALSASPILSLPAGSDARAVADTAQTVGTLLPLLAVTAIVLFLPKALGTALAVSTRARSFGGRLRLVASALVEAGFSVVVAPLMMMYHTRFVAEILSGRDVAWGTQVREGRRVPWGEAVARTAGITLAGVTWSAATLTFSPAFFLWLTPIFTGLLLAAPIVRWTSITAGGPRSTRPGILASPSEVQRPPELASDGRALRGSHMFLAATETVPPATSAVGMYEAERGLFDLQRGRPVLVTPPEDAVGARPVLVAAVEGLTAETLHRLRGLGCDSVRLILTRHRASAMGIRPEDQPDIHVGVSLRIDDATPEQILRLASASSGFDLPPGDVRAARSEEAAGLALTRLARLLPAAIAVETDRYSSPALAAALDSGAILEANADSISALMGDDTSVEVTYVSDAPVPLEEAENVRFMLFREANGLTEHVAIIIGDRDAWPDPVPVRLHSACLTGDLFGSLRCDCGEQLRRSLQMFSESGGGVLLYLEQEGRGIGLGNKLRAYSLQQEGLDTVDADCVLGFGADERRYHAAVGILRHLGVSRVRLLTNNPEKLQALEEAGIEVVDRTPLHGTLNRHNLPYVRAKVQRAGHWLGDMLHGRTSAD
jgi:membrane glycosyltransferase